VRVIQLVATPPRRKSILDLVSAVPSSSEEDMKERVGPAAGIRVSGLDALSSAAYGPEAALTALIPLGVAASGYIVP
jgi:hypothetical protein